MTNLYINSEHCLNINQLEQYFHNLSEGSDIYLDLLDYAKSGDLTKWLKEHNENLLASKVNDVDNSIGDSEYMNILSEIFGSTSSLNKPLFRECFTIGDISYEIVDELLLIKVPVTIIKSINENYLLTLESSWDRCSTNFNTFNHISGEKTIVELSLSPIPNKRIEEISLLVDNFENCRFKVFPKICDDCQYLIVEDSYKSRFDVFDSDGKIAVPNLSSLQCYYDTLSSGYIVGCCKNDGTIYIVSKNGIQDIGSYGMDSMDNLRLYHNEYSGDLGAIICIQDTTGATKEFVMQDGTCISKEDYMDNFCKTHNLPYQLLNVKVIGNKEVRYIGKKNGDALFVVNSNSSYREVINANGDVKWYHEYNSIVSPTFNESLYIATNCGRKYSKCIFITTDNSHFESYKLPTDIKPTIWNETPTSITISPATKYLKSPEGGIMIGYLAVNKYFYIKTATYQQNNLNPNYCSPALHLMSNDKMVEPINRSYTFENNYFEDLGNGYIAIETSRDTVVVIAPDGSIVYTLKESEVINQKVKRGTYSYYYAQTGFGLSEGAFIVKDSHLNLYRVISYDGNEICNFNTNECIEHGFHAGKIVFHTPDTIGFFDDKGLKHIIPWEKNQYIHKINVLFNGNILVHYQKTGQESMWILINTEGTELLKSADPINILS